jgi:dienelactone hydrolase
MNSRTLAVFAILVAANVAYAQGGTHTELFYSSGSLKIQAYLYRPPGEGRFPVVIYNHGSRDGRERASVPFEYIGRMLTKAGYVVLVPERRGYGKSDGAIWWHDVGNDSQLVARLQAETDDVLASLGYLQTLDFADTKRMAVMGWSLGGIVTMFAASRSNAFLAAVNQAGAALSWDVNPSLRAALMAAAEKSATPTLFMVASNDRTTSSITTLADIYKARGIAHRAVIYKPFTPTQGRPGVPGHAVFGAQGTAVWEADVVQFLDRHLKRNLSEADTTLMGMRIGKDMLSDVLSRIGNTPLAPRGGEAPDELCYAAENPFEQTWVVFGADARGNWERLTYFRVLSTAPTGLTCRRTPLITASLATDSGIHKGMSLQELHAKFGSPSQVEGGNVVFASARRTLRGSLEDGRLTAFEIMAE